VVGVGGEKVAIKNKKVFINDKPLDEPYAVHRDTRTFPLGSMPRDNYGPLEVPAKSVFVMGDNRDHSNDSRFWGCVENRDIIGRARFIYWSKDRSRIRTEIESSPQAAKTK
jgi:signal peptidase I